MPISDRTATGSPPGVGRITWLDAGPVTETRVHDGEALRFRVGATEFDSSHAFGSSPDRFLIRKHRALVEAYLDGLTRTPTPNVVEVGLADGGSMALAALATEPRRHVGLELDENRLAALDALLARHGVDDRFATHFGVDQADRQRVAEIVDAEFGGERLDVVIDDASHLLGPTRTSFEVLFPRLRPGGIYFIEDWSWDHLIALRFAAALREEGAGDQDDIVSMLPVSTADRAAAALATTPLSILILELTFAVAESDQIVAGIDIGPWAVSVTRGPADLDPRAFRLTDAFSDHLHLHPRDAGIGSLF